MLSLPTELHNEFFDAVHDAIRDKGFTRGGSLMAFHVWGGQGARRTANVSDMLEPYFAALMQRESKGRLFRLNDAERVAIRIYLAISMSICGWDNTTARNVNRAALDLGIAFENMVSEYMRIQAGGKPRD